MDPFALNLIMILGFVIGTGLIVAEAFIPGFGVAGISGIVLEIVAIWACCSGYGLTAALLALAAVLAVIGAVIFFSYRSALNGRLSKSPLILRDTENAAAPDRPEEWIGKEGVAVTALRPGGQIESGGVRLQVTSDGALIEKGAPVVITGSEGARLLVRRREP